MKVGLKPLMIFFTASCMYDPPLKGKEVLIHNQTNQAVLILESLTDSSFKLYDTAFVNGRKYISKPGKNVLSYTDYIMFISSRKIESIKKKNSNQLKLFIIRQQEFDKFSSSNAVDKSYRSIDLNLDTIQKYNLNHLFVTCDSVFFEHYFDYSTIRNFKK